MRNAVFFSILMVSCPIMNAQSGNPDLTGRKLEAVRTEQRIKTDGLLDEEAWLKANVAGDFIMYNPYNGIPSEYRTEVKVLYDDEALFIGAMMYDNSPDSIFTELGARDDDDINADNFYIEISPFNDGLNGELFKVTASGVQIDNKLSTEDVWFHEDTWDAVWESHTAILKNGWSAEIRIPYSALRFSKAAAQMWGINFWREVRRDREVSSWSFVNKEYGSTITHMGELGGLRDITPPFRLSLVPYVSGYLEKMSDDPGVKTSYNGGLDLKLGLSESFTLDATLIPDFGQVQSDDHVLNLTPYEVKYNENRPFFMEGTELFKKGNIFYSRRIGGVPHLMGDVYDQLLENEYVSENPAEVSLINATKISGRTRNGLGLGVFNAITNSVYTEVKDSVTGETRKILTEPLTNYNMIVFDQNLKNNSYVSLANTNVIRNAEKDENFYTANITSFETLVKTKNQLYSVAATANLSQKYYTDSVDLGHAIEFNIGKTGGAFRTDYNLSLMSDTYDPNDMGYIMRNNELEHSVDFSYNVFEPKGHLMMQQYSLDFSYNQLYKPRVFTSSLIDMSCMIVFMNYWSLSLGAGVSPWGENDYFEPRTDDMSMYYFRSPGLLIGLRGDTDKSKKLYAELSVDYGINSSEYDQSLYDWSVQALYRIGRKFSIEYSLAMERAINDIGYVGNGTGDEIFFGKRGVSTIEHTLSGAFIFTANSYLSLRGRYYWSKADYDGDYFLLLNDGTLEPSAYEGVPDLNTSFFNIDMAYTWRFAPGSELSIVWKNAIRSFTDYIIENPGENFSNMLGEPQSNSISLKILYYLDYQNFKKLFSHK
jgi:hypothetical protein